MSLITRVFRRNPYIQFVSVVILVLGIYGFPYILGHTPLSPLKVNDNMRLFTLIPLVFGGGLNMLPESYQGKERRARIFFFVNSNSFSHFIGFWVFVTTVTFMAYVINSYDFHYKYLFEYIDLAVLSAGYVCFAITCITLGRLLTRPRGIVG